MGEHGDEFGVDSRKRMDVFAALGFDEGGEVRVRGANDFWHADTFYEALALVAAEVEEKVVQ